MASELEALRQETEQLKNQIRVSILVCLYFIKTTKSNQMIRQTDEEDTGKASSTKVLKKKKKKKKKDVAEFGISVSCPF